MTKDKNIITPQQFIDELRRYQKGSVTRRHFLGVTGLGLATAVLGGAMPGLKPRKAYAALAGTVNFTTWPNYFAQENFDKFTKDTGVKINISVFGSNEEMLAKLQAGATGWDVFVPTNYTISTYKELDLIEPLDLAKLPNYDAATQDQRFTAARHHRRQDLCRAEGLGHHRLRLQHQDDDAEASELEGVLGPRHGRATGRVMVHDYQLTTIGNALKYFGYSFNSIDEKELAEAEKLLIAAKPHLFGINSDYQPSMRNGDAWMSRVLDRRRHPAAARHAGDAVRARQGRRRDLDRLLRHPEGRAEPRRRPMPHQLPADARDQRQGGRRRTAIRPPIRGPTSWCRRRCWRIRSSIRQPSCFRRWNSARRRR